MTESTIIDFLISELDICHQRTIGNNDPYVLDNDVFRSYIASTTSAEARGVIKLFWPLFSDVTAANPNYPYLIDEVELAAQKCIGQYTAPLNVYSWNHYLILISLLVLAEYSAKTYPNPHTIRHWHNDLAIVLRNIAAGQKINLVVLKGILTILFSRCYATTSNLQVYLERFSLDTVPYDYRSLSPNPDKPDSKLTGLFGYFEPSPYL